MGDLVIVDHLGESRGARDVQANELDAVHAVERNKLEPAKVAVEVCCDHRRALVE